MADEAHKETDKRLLALERALRRHYREASADVAAIQAEELAGYHQALPEMRARVESGEMDADELELWLIRQSTSLQARQAAAKAADRAVRADVEAADMVNGVLAGVYAINRQQTYRQLAFPGFTVTARIVHEATAEEIAGEYRLRAAVGVRGREEYAATIQRAKDHRWSEQHFTAAVQTGIRYGYSNQRMERAVKEAMGRNYNASVRMARTYCTGIENLGRLDEARRWEAEGYTVTKEWLSAHDKRTRDSHRLQDGETVGAEEAFTNGLMYPGDRSTNDPGEFINCRCRMIVERARP